MWNDEYFTPVGCFLLFNVGSYFGIVLSSFCKWPDASRSGSIILLNFSIARLVFIPFFIFCNIEPFNRKVTNVSILIIEFCFQNCMKCLFFYSERIFKLLIHFFRFISILMSHSYLWLQYFLFLMATLLTL